MGKHRNDIVGYHRSKNASKNLDKRIRDSDDLDELIQNDFMYPDEIMHEQADTKHMVATLEERLRQFTVPMLRELLASLGAGGIARKVKKDQLVAMAHKLITNDHKVLLAPYIARGQSFLEDLVLLAYAGGRQSVLKRDLRNGDASPDSLLPAAFPTTILVEEWDRFTLVLPKEVAAFVEDPNVEEWHEIRELSWECQNVHVIGGIMADLCGVVTIGEVLDYIFGPRPVAIPDDLLAYLLDNGPWITDELMWIISDGSDRYFASYSFLEKFVPDDESDLYDREIIGGILAARARIKRRTLNREIDNWREGNTVRMKALHSPEGRALIALIDDHVPNPYRAEDDYAISIASDIIELLRATNDVSIIDGLFARQGYLVRGELAQRLYDAAEAVSYRIPKWHLNGWSYAELDEYKAAGTLEKICTCPDEVAWHAPSHRDCSEDTVSGYVYIGSEKEAERLEAKADLQKAFSRND